MSNLNGIIVPLVTPLQDRNTLDTEGLERLIEHVIGNGVDAVFILGSTGEAPALSYKLRLELIERTARLVADRVKIQVGITDTSFEESLTIANAASEHGADSVVLAPPYYFTTSQQELIEYINHITGQLPLPLYLYNMPGLTKTTFEPETVLQLADNPKIAGLKDSSANMMYFHKLKYTLRNHPDFALFTGPEELLAESVLLGGNGGVCGGANFFPSLYVSLYQACKNKDLDTVAELHRQIIKISSTIYCVGKYGSSFLKGVKCALSLMGICNDFISEPFHHFREKEREEVRKHLLDLGLL
ncbi:dihydrodipicolinate synthase family protein [Tichowtungia aerotolerans]|uniref:Dihydrodipicolinate synthase family protein n=1 Tax=Tichowtungia aerotolerans TaxID=2697043 RepID=A0A6P1MC61_9BACT|nr:dihydrodipicolinate synthase family protein [Tichowtungia aerotolerans]QHI69176.1 dihydrodipicolinate synthase family protein [Tichowtungia aerotolerans]